MEAALVVGLALGAMFGAHRLYLYWIGRPRSSDIAFVKAKLEEFEHRVVDIRLDGFHDGGRYGLSYRKYRVVVRSPLGGPDTVREMGVWANLFGMRGLVDLNKRHP